MGTASPRKHKWRQTDPQRTMTAASELDSSNKKSRSSRALEEGAGSSAQQGRRQGRDLSSLSTALWTQEWHLGSLAEGLTESGQDYEGLFLHLGPWEREPRWAGNTSPLTNSSTTLRAGANPEKGATQDHLLLAMAIPRKLLTYKLTGFHNSWLNWVNWGLLLCKYIVLFWEYKTIHWGTKGPIFLSHYHNHST